MSDWLQGLQWYLKQVIKIVVESIAFLVPAILVAKIVMLLFQGAITSISWAPAAIAAIVFGIAMRENYCCLKEIRYGFGTTDTEKGEASTLDEFEESDS